MSLLTRAYQKLPSNIPDEDKKHIERDIADKDTLTLLRNIEDNRELLKKLNKLEFIMWHIQKLGINLDNEKNLLIIFQERLGNLYKLTKNVPQILEDLWNGKITTKEEYKKQEYLEFIKHCVLYWRDLKLINLFWNDNLSGALWHASRYERLEVVKYLIKNANGAILNLSEALWNASLYGYFEVVKYIVENANGKNLDLNEALYYASRNGRLEVVKYLIENANGANINLSKTLWNASIWGRLEVVKYIVENANGKNLDLSEALYYASRNGRLEVVKYIVENANGANINLSKTLWNASVWARFEVVKYIVENTNRADLDINKALWYASANGCFEVVKYIVENTNRADLDLNEALKQALKYRYQRRYFEIVKYLKLFTEKEPT